MPSSTSTTMVMITFVAVAVMLSCVSHAAIVGDEIKTPPPGYGPRLYSKNYAGYISLPNNPSNGNTQFAYYYFIESERDPSNDPLVLWLNGGPGCSSLLGWGTEVGPYMITRGGNFTRNPYSWTTVANVLFLEAPPGVGFAADIGQNKTIWNDTNTAEANYNFLSTWVNKHFPEYKNHDLYLTGESYAGHYVPHLASKIQHGPDPTLKSMMKGLMVGNPCTGTADGDDLDWCFKFDPTLIEYLQGHAFLSFDKSIKNAHIDDWGYPTDNTIYDPYDILERTCQWQASDMMMQWEKGVSEEESEAVAMSVARTPAQKRDAFNAISEKLATEERRGATEQQWLQEAIANHQQQSSELDVAARTTTGLPHGVAENYAPCSENYLQAWLNREDVREALHVNAISRPNKKWSACADIVYPTSNTSKGVLSLYRDFMDNTNYKLLIYSGDADTVVNFVQTEKIIISLNRPVLNAQNVRSAVGSFRPWFFQDTYKYKWKQLGGWFVNYDRISWASVKGAGHMVPTYVPAAALQLLNSFIATGRPGLAPPTTPYGTDAPATDAPSTGSPATTTKEATCSNTLDHWREVELVLGGILLGGVLTFTIIMVFRHWNDRRKKRSAMPEEQADPLYHEG